MLAHAKLTHRHPSRTFLSELQFHVEKHHLSAFPFSIDSR
jgi:hypothetical protein